MKVYSDAATPFFWTCLATYDMNMYWTKSYRLVH